MSWGWRGWGGGGWISGGRKEEGKKGVLTVNMVVDGDGWRIGFED